MKKLIILITLFFVTSCASFEEHVREIKQEKYQARLKEYTAQCSSLGLKPGTVDFNVCVDRKQDIYNARAQTMYKIKMQCIIDGGVWIGHKCDKD